MIFVCSRPFVDFQLKQKFYLLIATVGTDVDTDSHLLKSNIFQGEILNVHLNNFGQKPEMGVGMAVGEESLVQT